MKILQVMTELGYGGAERVVLELCRTFVKQGHSVSLAVMKDLPERNMLEQFRESGVEPEILGINSFRDLKKIFRFRRLIRSLSPDVIHSHLMHPNLISRFACCGTGIPLVNTIHISEKRSGQGLFFFLDFLSFGLCGCCTAVSDASARFHEGKLHLETGTIRTIRNGVNPAGKKSPEELQTAKNRWQVNMCSRILGAVGRLDRQKGFDRLIRVLPALERHVPDGELWGVVILGEGPERSALEDMLRGCQQRKLLIQLPGFEQDAASFADAFDAFVMPSRYEGYGLVLAEAVSLGLPCVYSPVDSLPELAEGVPNTFPARFDLPEKDEETARIIASAMMLPRTAPRTLFSVEDMADEYFKLYMELLKKRNRG